jgi:hypothetical protein
METSRSVPQHTAQIFSAFAGQKRPGLRFSQIGQSNSAPINQSITPAQAFQLALETHHIFSV